MDKRELMSALVLLTLPGLPPTRYNNPQAESLKYKLLGGLAVRRACYGVLRFIMESGAKGAEVKTAYPPASALATLVCCFSTNGLVKLVKMALCTWTITSVQDCLSSSS